MEFVILGGVAWDKECCRAARHVVVSKILVHNLCHNKHPATVINNYKIGLPTIQLRLRTGYLTSENIPTYSFEWNS
jgi:hypothetical protein